MPRQLVSADGKSERARWREPHTIVVRRAAPTQLEATMGARSAITQGLTRSFRQAKCVTQIGNCVRFYIWISPVAECLRAGDL